MTVINIIEIDGSLYTKKEEISDPFLKDFFTSDPILIYRYESGDVDAINWPNPNLEHLRGALFDCRETGIIADCNKARLPDGTVIDF